MQYHTIMVGQKIDGIEVSNAVKDILKNVKKLELKQKIIDYQLTQHKMNLTKLSTISITIKKFTEFLFNYHCQNNLMNSRLYQEYHQ